MRHLKGRVLSSSLLSPAAAGKSHELSASLSAHYYTLIPAPVAWGGGSQLEIVRYK